MKNQYIYFLLQSRYHNYDGINLFLGASFVAWMVKNLPAMRETQVQAPLQYSCLENPLTEEPGGLQSMVSQRQTQLRDYTFTFNHLLFWIYEFTMKYLQG